MARKSPKPKSRRLTPRRLQCDRATNGAEMLTAMVAGTDAKLLQCDRATNGAEIQSLRPIPGGLVCFNVTAPRMARKSLDKYGFTPEVMALQCDRATNGAEISPRRRAIRPPQTLQCDRATNGAEILAPTIMPGGTQVLQCDRATNGAEMFLDAASDRVTIARFNVTAPRMARKSGGRVRPRNHNDKLQCDRATNGAEMRMDGIWVRAALTLQCDRATNGAEITARAGSRQRWRDASM